jgi:hypothetical protein
LLALDAMQNSMSSVSIKEPRLHGRSVVSVITKQFIYEFSFDKVIYSVTHNPYIANTQLATCFSYSELTSGQFLVYRHGAFSEGTHYGAPYCLQTIFILKFKLTH